MIETAPLLETRDVVKHFPIPRRMGDVLRGSAPQAVHAVDGVSIAIRPGETLGLIGESGSGKSTLGWVIARLHPITQGSIRFDGRDATSISGIDLVEWRRNVQIVFQDPVGSLDPRLHAWQLVGEAVQAQNQMSRRVARLERVRLRREHRASLAKVKRENRGARQEGGKAGGPPTPLTPIPAPPSLPAIPPRLTRAAIRRRVWDVLPTVGLPSECLDQYPHEFSGGGRQRLSLARALIVNPKLVILDEPTSALDVAVQAQILNRLVALQKERGYSYMLITHNVAAVRYVAHRVAVMYLGQIVEVGGVREVLEHPIHPYTKALLAAVPVADARRRRTRYRITGEIPTLLKPPPGCRFAARCPFVIDRCRTEEPPLREIAGRPDRKVSCHRAEDVAEVAPEALLAPAGSSEVRAPPLSSEAPRES